MDPQDQTFILALQVLLGLLVVAALAAAFLSSTGIGQTRRGLRRALERDILEALNMQPLSQDVLNDRFRIRSHTLNTLVDHVLVRLFDKKLIEWVEISSLRGTVGVSGVRIRVASSSGYRLTERGKKRLARLRRIVPPTEIASRPAA